MTVRDNKVSGNIYAEKDRHQKDGESFVIICPVTGSGLGLPTRDIEPEDLRILADRIEKARAV